MKKVKLGIVGIGGMGNGHLRYIKGSALAGQGGNQVLGHHIEAADLPQAELVAVCDIVKERADQAAKTYGCDAYYDHHEMLAKADLDACLIATPHFEHIGITIDSFFEKGIHVLCEKPITVHVNGAKKMIASYEAAKVKNPNLVFGIMFNERTWPHHKKIKDILEGGELGRLTRVTWINTAWFRSQAYYDGGGWRATWKGEGGGILTNQCPHNLDMYNWLFGLPEKVHGFAHIGKYHDIEVEDEVTAYMEHADGMIGHFIVTTAECPGTNRLEIVGEHGTLVYEKEKLVFHRNRSSMLDYIKTTPERFAPVENWETHIPINYNQPQNHKLVTEKFLNSILSGKEDLVAHGTEGLNQVMLANAIMLSSFEERAVRLPMDGDLYEKKLEELIAVSKTKKV